MFETTLLSVSYVINAPFFYSSMGMTAATSIFIGAAMYNGELKPASKGILAVLSYAILLLITTLPRVFDRLNNSELAFSQERTSMAYAGAITIFFLTIWYILGILIGVYTVQRAHKKKVLV